MAFVSEPELVMQQSVTILSFLRSGNVTRSQQIQHTQQPLKAKTTKCRKVCVVKLLPKFYNCLQHVQHLPSSPPPGPPHTAESRHSQSRSLVVILDIFMLLWRLGSSWVQSVPLLFSTVTKLIIKMSPIKYNTVGNSLQ